MAQIKKQCCPVVRLILSIYLCAFLCGAASFEAWAKPAATKSEDIKKQEKILKMYAGYKRWSFRKARDITVEGVFALKGDKRIIFVDVRDPEEQAVSMIADAIPYQKFETEKGDYRDAVIIAYCTIGSRSGQYTEELMKQGFEAYNLIGGILSWTHAGQLLFHDGRQVKRAHVYGRRWDLLPESYHAVY